MLKKDLRKLYLKKRKDLPQEKFLQLNKILTQKVFEKILDIGKKNVFLFLPLINNNEFDCRPLAKKLWDVGLNTYLPITNFETKKMKFSVFNSSTQLIKKKYDLQEPIHFEACTSSDVIVITPLLISDVFYHRVGYGGGFYDRFFMENSQYYKLGVSFFSPIDRIKDASVNDVKLDDVIYST